MTAWDQPYRRVLCMYGLVNRAVEDLVRATAGDAAWDSVKAKIGQSDLKLLDTKNYDDQLTLDLVTACSELMDLPQADVIKAFGRHWIEYTGREGWTDLFAMTAEDFIGFIRQLDEMHERVNAAMPEGKMPQFTLQRVNEHFELVYSSARDGFAPMVMGILEGLAEQYDEHWEFAHIGSRDENGVDTFSMHRIVSSAALDTRDAA